jgi:hypothetical protein
MNLFIKREMESTNTDLQISDDKDDEVLYLAVKEKYYRKRMINLIGKDQMLNT